MRSFIDVERKPKDCSSDKGVSRKLASREVRMPGQLPRPANHSCARFALGCLGSGFT